MFANMIVHATPTAQYILFKIKLVGHRKKSGIFPLTLSR